MFVDYSLVCSFVCSHLLNLVRLKADASIWLEFGSRARDRIYANLNAIHTAARASKHIHNEKERYILCEANKRFCTPKNFTAAYQDYVLLTQLYVLLLLLLLFLRFHPLLLLEMLFLLFAMFLLCVLSIQYILHTTYKYMRLSIPI